MVIQREWGHSEMFILSLVTTAGAAAALPTHFSKTPEINSHSPMKGDEHLREGRLVQPG